MLRNLPAGNMAYGQGCLVIAGEKEITAFIRPALLLEEREGKAKAEKTPLQRQLDSLSKIIATIAGIALALVVVLGLVRGESFETLFITGVALGPRYRSTTAVEVTMVPVPATRWTA